METAERLVADLAALGVERVYGYPGGRVIELFDHLADSPIEVVRPRDEREASVMAEAHGRLLANRASCSGRAPGSAASARWARWRPGWAPRRWS